MAVAEEAVVPDAVKSIRQHMDQEAADELASLEGHRLLAAAVPVILTWGASGQGGDSFMRPHMGSFGSRGRFVHASSSSLGWFGSTFRSLSASVDISPLPRVSGASDNIR